MKKLFVAAAVALAVSGAMAQTADQRTVNITASTLWPGTSYAMPNTTIKGRVTADNVRTDSIYMSTENGGFNQFGKSEAVIGSDLRLDINGKGGTGGNLIVEGNATFEKGLNANNKKITGVGNGVAGKDAVNVDQLNTKADKTALDAEEKARIEGDIQTLESANKYTDGQVNVVEGKVVDLRTDLTTETADRIEGDKRTAAEANAYADAGDARTLQQANSYSDAGDARTLGQANAYTDTQIKALDGKLTKQINEVGAMAMAASVAGSASPAPGDKTAVTAALGTYSGEHAVAVGVTHIIAPNKRLFATISSSGRKTGAGVGASFSFK